MEFPEDDEATGELYRLEVRDRRRQLVPARPGARAGGGARKAGDTASDTRRCHRCGIRKHLIADCQAKAGARHEVTGKAMGPRRPHRKNGAGSLEAEAGADQAGLG